MNRVRCAIYTRKSSEEGLEQSFNSLDAQREACAAYILSQASEGWFEVAERYDDGGLSGGTLQRPALQRLLADVAAKRVDNIVVYKVDRLTRSLLDFSKLVEAFDAAGTSFVSVTQSFSTTTSMGRLTLNMLLSFAQFEREVTAERIRDKIAASKAKGMWMGGLPPLGYRPDGRSLAIVEEHAELVRHIFQRYLELGNVRLLEDDLARRGITVPHRSTSGGKAYGGGSFSRGLLHQMLRRVTYRGKIAHKGKAYAGSHAPLLDPELFERVQQQLEANIQGRRSGARSKHPSLLAGKVVDEAGEPLIATHSTKPTGPDGAAGNRRFRYYVGKAVHHRASPAGLRIPAREIESAVVGKLAELLGDPLSLLATASLDVHVSELQQFMDNTAKLASRIRGSDHELVRSLVREVRVGQQDLQVICDMGALATLLSAPRLPHAAELLTLTVDVRLTRTGHVMRLVQENGTALLATPDLTLIGLIAKAHRWWGLLKAEPIDVRTLAEREGVSKSYVSRVVRLAFLSPEVVQSVLNGSQHAGLRSAMLKQMDAISPDWAEQKTALVPAG